MFILSIASDHSGIELKKKLIKYIESQGMKALDYGCFENDQDVDYPDYARKISESLLHKDTNIGILICGTGIGMSIAANRHPMIRAALCNNVEAARLARQHNNANVLCLGARVISVAEAEYIVSEFLCTDFAGGRHARRVAKLG